ncbi:MAG TPA: asparagine synthase-related protein [Mycobacteriales bacterium]|nr:asparagine synthase-related protein [Mycobacteriales bacterium]
MRAPLIGGLLGHSGHLAPAAVSRSLAAAPWRGAVAATSGGRRGAVWALGAASLSRVDGYVVGLHGRIDNLNVLAPVLGCPAEAGAVLAAAARRWGPQAVDRLRGDFAALLLEETTGQLLAWRDWMATHPLFYGTAAGVVVFASETVQVRGAANLPVRPDEAMCAAYAAVEPLALDRTFHTGVAAVLANGWAIASGSTVSTGAVAVPIQRIRADRAEAIVETRRLLGLSVARRLPEGLRVGSAISGGMDSTSVAAAAQQVLRSRGTTLVAGYNLAFPGVPECDEGGYAAAVAARLDTPLRRVEVDPRGFPAQWSRAVELHDGPLHAVSPLFLSIIHTAAPEVDVYLNGQGGDHWFTPRWDYLAESLQRGDLGSALEVVRVFRAQRAPLRPLLAEVARTVSRAARGTWQREAPYRDDGWGRLATETEERAGAQVGTLVTAPLYDRDLAEFVLGLPPSYHGRRGTTKLLLREGMADELPDQVRFRPDKTEFSPLLRHALGLSAHDKPVLRANEEILRKWRTSLAVGPTCA